MSEYIQQNQTVMSFDGDESWVIMSPLELSIKRKIETVGVPLKEWDIKIYRGVLTGFNEAFIISGQKKDELIAADPKSAEIIRPILRGRDIKRYTYDFSDSWLIYVPWHFPLENDETITGASADAELSFKEQYPAVYNHLLSYKNDLSKRNKAETGIRYEWYALQRWGAKYKDDFNRQKIVWGEISDNPKFALDINGDFCVEATTFMMTGDHLWYVLCILNSSLSQFFFSKLGTTTGVGTLRWKKYKLEEFAIPPIHIISNDLMSKLTESFNDPIKNYDQINSLVFQIYGLSNEEIEYIISQQS